MNIADSNEQSGQDPRGRLAVMLVPVSIALLLLVIPLKITGLGFLPPDDALRHAAKVIAEKNWQQILVLRPDIVYDSHPGWHAMLAAVHRAFNLETDGLVVFSVVATFVLFTLTPLFLMRRPEAWLLALLALAILDGGSLIRVLLGRPFVVSMAVLLVLCLRWRPLDSRRASWGMMAAFTLMLAASTWIHCSWYLWGLPLGCFALARRWRAALRLGACMAVGIPLGASFTGHPWLFLRQTIVHGLLSVDGNILQRMLVIEFQPSDGSRLFVLGVLVLLAWRQASGRPLARRLARDPVFILGLAGLILGYKVSRFWTDWGLPALLVWTAREIERALTERVRVWDWRRMGVAGVAGAALFCSLTADLGGRWTNNLTTEYLDAAKPDQAEWLPEPGGIFYNATMHLFYQTFYKNPHADWRYVLGFEPSMMPAADLAIYRKIQWNYSADEAFVPWVARMRRQDRLAIVQPGGQAPKIPGLEWHYTVKNIWIGRLPRQAASTVARPTRLDPSTAPG